MDHKNLARLTSGMPNAHLHVTSGCVLLPIIPNPNHTDSMAFPGVGELRKTTKFGCGFATKRANGVGN